MPEIFQMNENIVEKRLQGNFSKKNQEDGRRKINQKVR